jgi:hypothetical protein
MTKVGQILTGYIVSLGSLVRRNRELKRVSSL